MSHWHYLMLEIIPEDQLVRPMLGAERDLDRGAAHGKIQQLLDGFAGQSRDLAALARTWQRGAKDDTVFHGPFIWTIYECGERPCEVRYGEVVGELADHFRAAGLRVDVAKPRDD